MRRKDNSCYLFFLRVLFWYQYNITLGVFRFRWVYAIYQGILYFFVLRSIYIQITVVRRVVGVNEQVTLEKGQESRCKYAGLLRTEGQGNRQQVRMTDACCRGRSTSLPLSIATRCGHQLRRQH